jgi:hypothetical protein
MSKRIVATFMDKATKVSVNVGMYQNPRKTVDSAIPSLHEDAARKLKCDKRGLKYLGFKLIDGPSVLGALPHEIKRGRY